ncbi:MAG: hypothetical protein ACYCWE_06590 [Eubacteriales bacterium]
MSYFVSVTCISAAMAVLGLIFEPETRFGYAALLYPHLFGIIASIPQFMQYSKKELSVKQTIIKNIIHFVLLELIILSFLYYGNALDNISVTLSVAISVFIIDLTVYLVLWTNDKKTAKAFNEALKKMQQL